MAAKWHPDKFDTPEEKKSAEKKFIDIAAAKEVLSDPGMIYTDVLLINKFVSYVNALYANYYRNILRPE